MPRFLPSMSESNSIQDVSVVDVYDLASEIGKECEKIIDASGSTELVQTLIPKCITALEMLEAFASEREIVANELQDLNAKIAKLEHEKAERSESRKRFEKELESIEESWRSETRDLLAAISRLQDENRRLHKKCNNSSSPSQSNSPNKQENEDFLLIQKLNEQVDKQRVEMKNKELEIEEKTCAIEAMKSEIESFKNSSVEAKRKSKTVQSQIQTLCEERADFLAKIQDQHREMITLKKQLGIAEKENEDFMSLNEEENQKPRFTVSELKEVLAERNELKKRVNDLEEELSSYKPISNPSPPSTPTPEPPKDPMMESIYDPYDLPVQGPLPQEPMDAPWKKSTQGPSGIRKFFRKLFSENDSGFPRSFTISTLTKMALSTPNNEY